MRSTRSNAWLAGPALALVALMVVPSMVLLVRLSLCQPAHGVGFYRADSFTWENFTRLLSPEFAPLIGFNCLFGLAVMAGVLPLAWLLAWPLRASGGGRLMIGLLVLVAPRLAGMLAPLVALRLLLPRGVVSAWLAEVFLITPYAALVLLVHLRGIDWMVLDAARGLGARDWQVWARVGLPLAWPGLWLAGQLALGWGLGAFLGPDILGGPIGRTLATDLHHQAFDNSRWPLAAAEGVLLLVLVGAVYLIRPFGWKRENHA